MRSNLKGILFYPGRASLSLSLSLFPVRLQSAFSFRCGPSMAMFLYHATNAVCGYIPEGETETGDEVKSSPFSTFITTNDFQILTTFGRWKASLFDCDQVTFPGSRDNFCQELTRWKSVAVAFRCRGAFASSAASPSSSLWPSSSSTSSSSRTSEDTSYRFGIYLRTYTVLKMTISLLIIRQYT